MVNFEDLLLNNPVGGNDGENRKKKKKRPKRAAGSNDEPSKKRKKFSDHSRSGDSEERTMSPMPRSRLKLKRRSERHQDKSGFDDELSGEERHHHKKGSVLQRLGERSASRIKGRPSGSSKLGMARKRGQMGRPPLRKREPRPKPICKFFMEGNCNKGDMCTFSHDTTPYKKRDLCKFYLHGYCTKEEACLFMHSDFPCKFFHTGAVCYADTECRFSHEPLTDETRMLLDRYLDSGPRGDRRRDNSPPNRMDRGRPPPHLHPPPPHHHHPNSNNNMNDCNMKMRPSLLGSPPPHIKEAANEWQQDLMMQMHQHDQSPPQMQRPNFYMDTMEESPQRGMRHGNARMNEMDNFQMPGPFPQQTSTCGDVTPSQGGATPIPTDEEGDDEDPNFPQPMQRRFYQGPPMARILPETEETISAAISAIRAESEFQQTPPHLEVERPLSPSSRAEVSDQPPNLLAGSPEHESTAKMDIKDEALKTEEPKDNSEEPGTDTSEADQSASEAPPVSFPSHLPRKQRELFMRIQQHQRLAKEKKQAEGESSTDDNEDQIEEKGTKEDSPVEEESTKAVEAEKNEIKVKEESLPKEIKKPEEEEEEEDDDDEEDEDDKPKQRWYSSDEDDDDNGDQPLTDVLKRLQQMPPPMVPPAASTPAAPAIDIAKMLSSIREQTSHQTGGLSSGLKSDFWQNILSATAPPANLPVPSTTEVEAVVKRDPRSRAPAPKLPPTQPTLPLGSDKVVNRTLNARDPRLSRTIGKQEEVPVIKPPSKPVEVHPPKEERVWESNIKDKKPGQSTYKLHTVTVMPLNYSSYLFASQNDTKLLEDPRIKKLLGGATPPRPMTSLPFPPELQQFLEQGEAKSTKLSPPRTTTPLPPTPPQPVQPTNLILGSGSGPVMKSDPRLKRNLPPPPTAQSPVHSGGFTPPHPAAPLMDLPPNLLPPQSGGFTPPTPPPMNPMMDMPNPLMMGFPHPGPPRPMNPMMEMGHMGMMPGPPPPMLHTHMPRGFIDPRFARLQQPMNPRRGRGNIRNIRHQGPPRKMHRMPAQPIETKLTESQEGEVDNKNPRKKQMDYSSPLSAYDESTPSEGSAYNRRPQQNTRTSSLAATPTPTPTPTLTPPPISTPQVNIPNNKTDISDEPVQIQAEDLNSASLRDVFKTIDPTASPFC